MQINQFICNNYNIKTTFQCPQCVVRPSSSHSRELDRVTLQAQQHTQLSSKNHDQTIPTLLDRKSKPKERLNKLFLSDFQKNVKEIPKNKGCRCPGCSRPLVYDVNVVKTHMKRCCPDILNEEDFSILEIGGSSITLSDILATVYSQEQSRYYDVINFSYGLNVQSGEMHVGKTHSEIAEEFGVTEERAKMLLDQATEKLFVQPDYTPIDILFEDDDIVVINKPPNLLSSPSYNGGTSVVHRLYGMLGIMPRVVHRLDYGTSGVMVLAKNKNTQDEMFRLFRQRKVSKTYLALTAGSTRRTQRDVSIPIGRSLNTRSIMTTNSPNTQTAKTSFTVLASRENVYRVVPYGFLGYAYMYSLKEQFQVLYQQYRQIFSNLCRPAALQGLPPGLDELWAEYRSQKFAQYEEDEFVQRGGRLAYVLGCISEESQGAFYGVLEKLKEKGVDEVYVGELEACVQGLKVESMVEVGMQYIGKMRQSGADVIKLKQNMKKKLKYLLKKQPSSKNIKQRVRQRQIDVFWHRVFDGRNREQLERRFPKIRMDGQDDPTPVLACLSEIIVGTRLEAMTTFDVAALMFQRFKNLSDAQLDRIKAFAANRQGQVVHVPRADILKDHEQDYLKYKMMFVFRGVSLIKCKPFTGRKHQIRVHLAHQGTPVLDDDVYGICEGSVGRLGLHAYQIQFEHPITRQFMRFKAPIHQDFHRVMKGYGLADSEEVQELDVDSEDEDEFVEGDEEEGLDSFSDDEEEF